MTTVTESVLDEVATERQRQDDKWGGPAHDDQHEPCDFSRFITYRTFGYKMQGRDSFIGVRRKFIQIAALAVAAVESIDRKTSQPQGE